MAFMGGTVSKHRELHDTEPFPWTPESLIIPEISLLLLSSKFLSCSQKPAIMSDSEPDETVSHSYTSSSLS
jgi:hypothetical protein